MLSRALASPGSRRGWKALTRARPKSLAVTSSQFREVALLEGATGSCRWGLHSLHILTLKTKWLF